MFLILDNIQQNMEKKRAHGKNFVRTFLIHMLLSTLQFLNYFKIPMQSKHNLQKLRCPKIRITKSVLTKILVEIILEIH